MKTTRILPAVLFSLAAVPAMAGDFSSNPADAKAGTYMLDSNHGKITWSLSHLGFSTYIGQFAKVTGTLKLDPKDPTKSTLTATVDIASVGTLNSVLDGELKGTQFFNAAKYPTATFVSTGIVTTGAKTADVTGKLTMLGVTQPETLHVTFNQSGTNPISHKFEVGFDAVAMIQRSAFGLKAYVPYVGDQVALQIEGEFQQS